MDNYNDIITKDVRCNTSTFAKLIGVTMKTLQRWDADGKLKAGRYPSGRRFYTEEHYRACGGDPERFSELIRAQKEGVAHDDV